jgi:hypothetical protein
MEPWPVDGDRERWMVLELHDLAYSHRWATRPELVALMDRAAALRDGLLYGDEVVPYAAA